MARRATTGKKQQGSKPPSLPKPSKVLDANTSRGSNSELKKITDMFTSSKNSTQQKTRLKRIKIRGFKSFRNADILLTDGFIAVAGANGSGKSNLSDSLRFVMGETSLKSLRARRSSDLVYYGAKEASVTLVFTNFEGKEFEIKRMIRGDGKNVYKLNGKTVSRTVLVDTLRRQGLTLGSHNVIVQGQVKRIVEMSPKERRTIIDNIAGISEYEEKKDEALRELEKVDRKISDATIVLNEREGFLTDLEREKNDALHYLDARDIYQKSRATLLYNELCLTEKNYAKITKKMEETEKEMLEVKKDVDLLDLHLKQLEEEKHKITQEINAQGQKNQLIDRLQQLKIDHNKSHLLKEERERELAKIKERLVELTDEKREIGALLSNLESRIENIKRKLDTLNIELKKYDLGSRKTGQMDAFYNNLEKETLELSERLLDEKEKLGRITVRIENIEELIRVKKEQIGLKDEDSVNLMDSVNAMSEMRKSKKGKNYTIQNSRRRKGMFLKEDSIDDANALNEEKKLLIREIDNIQNEIDKLFETEKTINKKLPSLDRQLLRFKEQAAELRPLVKGVRFSPTTSFIRELSNSSKAKANKIKGLHGIVEDIVTYDEEFSEAIVAAAGSRMQYAVVEDVDTAARVIALLRKKGLGRSAFIPLTRPVRGEKAPLHVKKDKGYMGMLIEHVKFDPKFYPAVEYVFGSTVIVKDINSAKRIGLGTCRMVTMTGEVFERSGVITGGSNRIALSVSAKKKLDCTEREIESIIAQRKSMYSELESVRSKISRLRKARTERELRLKEIEIRLNHIDSVRKQIAIKRKDIEHSIKELINEKKRLSEELKNARARVTQLTKQLTDKRAEMEQHKLYAEDKRIERVSRYKELLDGKNALIGEYESLKKEYELVLKRQGKIDEELADTHQRRLTIVKEIKKLAEEVENAEKKICIVEKEIRKKSAEVESLWEELNKFEKQIEETANQKGRLSHNLEKLKDMLKNLEIKKATESTRLADLRAEYEEYKDVPLLDVDKKQLSEMMQKAETTLNEMKDRVNLRAPEMYEEKKKEITEIKDRIVKLKEEKDSIMVMINEIESKKKRIFLETFTKVNENFKKLFGFVFDGEGTLVLTNASDPFNSALNIRIRLNGQDRYIDAMSGGEKSLLALIFIFSLQMTKPSPFYLLDEAEAALDKENSKKMAELIKRMSQGSQFIVITHNDEVLRSSDVAFGISMTDKGSVVLGIELNTVKVN